MENQNLSIFMAVCDGHNDTILVYCNYSSLAQTPAEYNMNFSTGSVQTQAACPFGQAACISVSKKSFLPAEQVFRTS
jgi:hypothetical protein